VAGLVVFCVKKLDLDRRDVVAQALEVGLRGHALSYLLLNVCLSLFIDVKVSLKDLNFLFRLIIEIHFGAKQPFADVDQVR
jgi:hypothetical protein